MLLFFTTNIFVQNFANKIIEVALFNSVMVRTLGNIKFSEKFWEISVSRIQFSSFPTWISASASHKSFLSWFSNMSIIAALSFQIDRKSGF